MAILSVPLTNSPPYLLLALALLKGDEVNWTEATSELAEPEYNGVKGVEAVRAALEEGIPGKEVSRTQQHWTRLQWSFIRTRH